MKNTTTIVQRLRFLLLGCGLCLVMASCSNPAGSDLTGGTVIDPPPTPQPYVVKLLANDLISGAIAEAVPPNQVVSRPAAFLEYADFYAQAPGDTNRVVIDTSGRIPKLSLNLKLVSKARAQSDIKEVFILQRFVVELNDISVHGLEPQRLTNGEAAALIQWRDLPASYTGGERIRITPDNSSLNDESFAEVFAWKVTDAREIRVRINAFVYARREYMLNNVKKNTERKVWLNNIVIRIPY